jgi:hypothetical protein
MKNSAINFNHQFGDVRIEKRANKLHGLLSKHQSVSINRISENWIDAVGNYRLLENTKVSIEGIKEGLTEACGRTAQTGHALLLQDTTQPNYERHRGRIKNGSGLGLIGDDKSLGYILHPTLVLDAEQGTCLGYSDIITWIREEGREKIIDKEKRKAQAIEVKESYRWLESIEQSRNRLQFCDRFTAIADREGDIYELFARIPDQRTDLLIRSRENRKIKEGKLFNYLSSQPSAGEYEIEIRGDKRTNIAKRVAKIEIRFTRVTLLKPARRKEDKNPPYVELYAVEAREKQETVPQGEEAVHWRILTTHEVNNFNMAVQVVKWYKLRWFIEQLFRVLKTDGFNIESSELENGESIIKIGIFAMGAALKVMQLLLASKGEYTQPIDEVFTKKEQEFLQAISIKYEGKTEKQKNPNKVRTLKWAAWIIARIGGWKGYNKQRPPGPITFFIGLDKYYTMYIGWNM